MLSFSPALVYKYFLNTMSNNSIENQEKVVLLFLVSFVSFQLLLGAFHVVLTSPLFSSV